MHSSIAKHEQVHDAVVQLLEKLRIPTKLTGYTYLVDAIELSIIDTNMITSMDKFLYPAIATKHKVSASSVRQAITLVINSAFDDLSNDLLYDTFSHCVSYKTGSVSNKAFIWTCITITENKLRS